MAGCRALLLGREFTVEIVKIEVAQKVIEPQGGRLAGSDLRTQPTQELGLDRIELVLQDSPLGRIVTLILKMAKVAYIRSIFQEV